MPTMTATALTIDTAPLTMSNAAGDGPISRATTRPLPTSEVVARSRSKPAPNLPSGKEEKNRGTRSGYQHRAPAESPDPSDLGYHFRGRQDRKFY